MNAGLEWVGFNTLQNIYLNSTKADRQKQWGNFRYLIAK